MSSLASATSLARRSGSGVTAGGLGERFVVQTAQILGAAEHRSRAHCGCASEERRRQQRRWAGWAAKIRLGSPAATLRSLLRDSRPPLKDVAGTTRVDGLCRYPDPIAPFLRTPRGPQSRGGVQKHDIATRSGCTLENFAGDAGIVLGAAAAHRLRVGRFQAHLARVELILLAAAVDLDHHGWAADGKLVHAIAGMENDRPLNAEASQDVGHLAREVGVSDAQSLVFGARRVAQRTEHVEHRAHAELFARKARESKRGVKDRREEKPDAGLANASRHAVRPEVDLHTELFEDVGRAAQ